MPRTTAAPNGLEAGAVEAAASRPRTARRTGRALAPATGTASSRSSGIPHASAGAPAEGPRATVTASSACPSGTALRMEATKAPTIASSTKEAATAAEDAAGRAYGLASRPATGLAIASSFANDARRACKAVRTSATPRQAAIASVGPVMARTLASPSSADVAMPPEVPARGLVLANATSTAVDVAAARRIVEGSGQAAVTRACLGVPAKGNAVSAAGTTTTPAG